jgi:uncharacterized protein (DUF2236 family)
MKTLYGPESAVWVLHGDFAGLVGGLRALAVQALEPRALAGVNQFSRFRDYPSRRLAETVDFIDTVTYGTLEEVNTAISQVKKLHEPVSGIDPVSGLPFAANDPELVAFIHNALVDSVAYAYRCFHPESDISLLDRYVEEMQVFAELMGADMSKVPATYGKVDQVIWQQETLVASSSFADAIGVLAKLEIGPPMSAVYPLVVDWVRMSMPDWVRSALGYRFDPAREFLTWAILRAVGELSNRILPGSPRRQRALSLRTYAA